MKIDFNDRLILSDGAMGTSLDGKYPVGSSPEFLNITNGKLIASVHQAYVDAGAQIIYTNTFGANVLKTGAMTEELIERGVKIAKEAAQDKALVALDVGPLGEMIEPIGSLTFDKAYDVFLTTVQAGAKAGADIIVIETVADLQEMRAAILAAKTTGLPVFATMTFTSGGTTFTGCTPESFALVADSFGVDALGANCSVGPFDLIPIAERLLSATDKPVIIKANAGMPDSNGSYDITPDQFIDAYGKLIDKGVSIVGGCCGTTPAYIAKLNKLIETKSYVPHKRTLSTAVCSATKVVTFEKLTVIGERINPTGKKLMKAALYAHDYDYVIKQAIEQRMAGADVLDINCGLPELNEPEVIETIVKRVSDVCALPLQIDSNNKDAVEKGLRIFCGRAIVNSVNGERKVLDNILPLVKKYGAMVVGLTLDENGIPDTVQGRLTIAERILKACEEYEISRNDVIIDPLTLTIATDADNAQVTIDTVKALKAKGIKTVLGISNISFGMPDREKINAEFLRSTAAAGLTLAIINPNVVSMMEAVVDARGGKAAGVFNAKVNIKGVSDENAEGFDINDCIREGLKKSGVDKTKELLKEHKPLEVIEILTAALDKVGDLYEKGELYLPQLIMSAEVAKLAFDEVRKVLPESSDKGVIVIATVKGDIHDIGKNIVKAVLSNYGYQVVDLGKNVDEAKVADALKETGAKLLGLSALMTTTAVNMKETVKHIRELSIDCKIMVGGAVITPEFAREIGADYYAKDANASVKIAREVLG